jgi:hypothetical protein
MINQSAAVIREGTEDDKLQRDQGFLCVARSRNTYFFLLLIYRCDNFRVDPAAGAAAHASGCAHDAIQGSRERERESYGGRSACCGESDRIL